MESSQNNIKWKPVIGYEGLYEVSSNGDIRSLDREINHWRGGIRISKGKILSKASFDKNGYKVVSLCKELEKKTVKVHRIVAKCFIENKFNKTTVNHINGIKSDNSVNNLEWNTMRENCLHRSLSFKKTSKYGNIYFNKNQNKWVASMWIENKTKHIGIFDCEEIAYNNLIKYKINYGINE